MALTPVVRLASLGFFEDAGPVVTPTLSNTLSSGSSFTDRSWPLFFPCVVVMGLDIFEDAWQVELAPLYS
jgi:ABC-type dipeptide/oligopeptide/nickel transport system permease subunit